jgi:hypothetical protein
MTGPGAPGGASDTTITNPVVDNTIYRYHLYIICQADGTNTDTKFVGATVTWQ